MGGTVYYHLFIKYGYYNVHAKSESYMHPDGIISITNWFLSPEIEPGSGSSEPQHIGSSAAGGTTDF